MPVVDPVTATTVGQLGAAWYERVATLCLLGDPTRPGFPLLWAQELVERHDLHALAELVREHCYEELIAVGLPDAAHRARQLADALDDGSAGLPQVHAHLDRVLAEIQTLLDARPLDLDSPVSDHGPAFVPGVMHSVMAARVLAHRLAGRTLDRSLPAPLLVRPEVPVRGDGPVSVVQVVDFGHPGGAVGRIDAWAALRDAGLAERVTWRTVHAPDAWLGDAGLRAAHLAEAVARVAPQRFDDAMDALARAYVVADPAQVQRLLDPVADLDRDAILAAADGPAVLDAVTLDRRRARLVGVPYGQPRFVVGQQLAAGPDPVQELLRLVAEP
jgi:hypothetical protein